MSGIISLCVAITLLVTVLMLTVAGATDTSGHQRSNEDLHAHILQHVASTASADVQAAAAKGVIERTIPVDRAAQFVVQIDLSLPRNTFQLKNTLHSGQDGVLIKASSGTAACKGFHHYLKYYCNCHLSWDGNQLDRLPAVWPTVDHSETSATPIVYYQNVCTWSYSFVWWKWLEWRRHIDWMAMNGITLTLAPVQELVWSEVYADLGMTGDEIDRHFAGPAFMAWQRMGNMRGWGGPLGEEFKRESSALQLLVIGAQRELGMAVALPAFAGHVPVAFARLFPNSSFTSASRWNRFSDEQCCPLYIDPLDPLFQTIGQQYLRRIVDLYGSSNHIYFSDPFNEMTPSQADADYIGQASSSIYAAMQAVDPHAVWLLQAWMFVNEGAFWTAELAEAFLRAVPLGRMLVLDLQSETQPQYQRMQSYFGQPFVWCMLHNFGGTSGMHGSVEVLNTEIAEARKMPNSTMIGFGITMEGINQNYAVYEFALERGWDQLTVPADKWFDKYALTRYGRASKQLQTALQHLRTSVYSYNGSIALHGQYIVCKRPGTKHSTNFWYNVTDIELSLRAMIAGTSEDSVINDLQYFDLVDITRQYLQTRIDLLYPSLITALKAKDRPQFQNISDRIADALESMELILSTDTRFVLGPWLQMAHRWAHSEEERQWLDLNARNQITLWGPNGEIVDYAIKQWAGVVGEYCLPRWRLFFADALEAIGRNKTINMTRFKRRVFKRVEKPFTMAYDGVTEHKTVPFGDALELAKGVLEMWAEGL